MCRKNGDSGRIDHRRHSGEPLTGGGPVTTHLDHRIAMNMAVAGLASSSDGGEMDDTRPIASSFPAFEALLDGLAG
jgi:3-phosphoshikimate 1-carboxyvinyltransferase